MIKIGIIKENKIPTDNRSPLTPKQAEKIKNNGIDIVCQTSDIRCFSDIEYKKYNIKIVDNLDDRDIIFGIKEVPIKNLINNKTYFFFSHTIKKQPQNEKLLKEGIKKKIKLIDYECLIENNLRIIAFGKYAGIAGSYNSLLAYGEKTKNFYLKKLSKFKDYKNLKNKIKNIKINEAFKILIIGNGKVANGATELLDLLKIKKINTSNYINKEYSYPVYCQLEVTDYMKKPDDTSFVENEYFNNPKLFKSNFYKYSNATDILINAAYWNPKSPKLFEEDFIMNKNFKTKVIGDISCDINGAIPCTKKASTIKDPFYDYNSKTKNIEKAFNNKSNITIMAVDNLPSELPKDSSKFFGEILIKKIIPLISSTKRSSIIENATIIKNGQLTPKYDYLKDYIR